LRASEPSLLDSLRLFCFQRAYNYQVSGLAGVRVNTEEAKDLVEILKHLGTSRKETANMINAVMHGFTKELHSTQKLWRKGNNSFLIKAGLALIAFPDPTITDIIGSAMVAAGIVQLKMKCSTLHVEDIYKTFPQVIKELTTSKLSVV